MRITEQDKRTFKKVVDFMQRMDQNGVYYTILEDLEYINPKELIAEILETFKQWKSDINSEEARQRLKEYRENTSAAVRLEKHRERKEGVLSNGK